MTREEGKNAKLQREISRDGRLSDQVTLVELPCIAHASGPDYDRLASTIQSKPWDYIVVTSPEAAKVLASAWDGTVREGHPLPVVAVGKATENVLRDCDIPVSFVPSKATAATLAVELDLVSGEGTTVLYPASARAQSTLEDGLSSRGFAVTRLNTYDTVTAVWTDEQREAATTARIACFASPSSIKGWLQNTGGDNGVFAACIGETSATACRAHGWDDSRIFFPDAPGLDGWVQAIQDALDATRNEVSPRTAV
jgi:uroporphyrinogen-III synthase